MSENLENEVPQLKRQQAIYLASVPTTTDISDDEAEEELGIFLDKLIREQEIKRLQNETNSNTVENVNK